MQEMAFPRLQISNFSGGACPRTPLEGADAFGSRINSEVTMASPVIYGQLHHWSGLIVICIRCAGWIAVFPKYRLFVF